MINNSAAEDVRKVLTGKDGGLYDDEGTLLATMETYQSQVNVSNAKYQPLGSMQEQEVPQSYSVTLNFTEIVIEDSKFIQQLMEGLKSGVMPVWNFQGKLVGRNGTTEHINYRSCVPSGTIDLQNLTVGDIVKRAWSLFVNKPPELQTLLTAADA